MVEIVEVKSYLNSCLLTKAFTILFLIVDTFLKEISWFSDGFMSIRLNCINLIFYNMNRITFKLLLLRDGSLISWFDDLTSICNAMHSNTMPANLFYRNYSEYELWIDANITSVLRSPVMPILPRNVRYSIILTEPLNCGPQCVNCWHLNPDLSPCHKVTNGMQVHTHC